MSYGIQPDVNNLTQLSTVVQPATQNRVGGVKQGANVAIAADGTISVAAPTAAQVQTDWSATSGMASILNRPPITWNGVTIGMPVPVAIKTAAHTLTIQDSGDANAYNIHVDDSGFYLFGRGTDLASQIIVTGVNQARLTAVRDASNFIYLDAGSGSAHHVITGSGSLDVQIPLNAAANRLSCLGSGGTPEVRLTAQDAAHGNFATITTTSGQGLEVLPVGNGVIFGASAANWRENNTWGIQDQGGGILLLVWQDSGGTTRTKQLIP